MKYVPSGLSSGLSPAALNDDEECSILQNDFPCHARPLPIFLVVFGCFSSAEDRSDGLARRPLNPPVVSRVYLWAVIRLERRRRRRRLAGPVVSSVRIGEMTQLTRGNPMRRPRGAAPSRFPC